MRVDLGQFSPGRLRVRGLPRISYTSCQTADDILDHVRRFGTTLLEDNGLGGWRPFVRIEVGDYHLRHGMPL